MSDINRLYIINLKDWRRKAAKTLKENESAYSCLKNKDSAYAKQVKALQDLHRKVFEIYRDAPDEWNTRVESN